MNWQILIKKVFVGVACAACMSMNVSAQDGEAESVTESVTESATENTTDSNAESTIAAEDTPAGACFAGPALLPQDTIASFLNNPSSLLQNTPVGGFQLSSQVRALAGSSNAAISELVDLADDANDAQIAAIGAGLAQTALSCVANRPDVAALIQEEVAASENEALITAFSAASGNIETSAITGSIGGVGGAPGGGVAGIGDGGTVGGAVGEDASRTFSNPAFSLSTRGSGGGSVGTTVEVVSPTL